MINNTSTKNIVFLGPEGTYCEYAKDVFAKNFGYEDYEKKFFTSIKNVIQFVDENPNSVGVVPVENSIEGIVRETMDNLLRLKNSDLKISAETVIDINHCLISKSNDITKIKKVVSYTQALCQCRNSLHNLLGEDFEFIEASSTAKAVKNLENLDDSYAAIGSEWSAKALGFNILNDKINDESDNKTRFILLTREKTHTTGHDKTSIVFGTNNEAGALVKVLQVFNDLNINLCYIDSRPSKKFFGEYNFFTDFEAHIEDEVAQKALESIKIYTNFVKILGSFKRF